MAGRDQLRGWKEVAAFLRTSVRTAKRWERERGLPVRRQPGGGRDLVFALPEDLDLWQRSDGARAGAEGGGTSLPSGEEGGESQADSAIPGSASDGAAPFRSRRRLLAAGSTIGLLALSAAALWFMGWPGYIQPRRGLDAGREATRARASSEPTPLILPFVQLDVAKPDGWKTTIQVADGGAAQIGPSPDHPTVILRPRITGTSLMLEIARADGRPVKDQGPASQPLVLVLDPNVSVQVRQPFVFSVRWVSAEPPSK